MHEIYAGASRVLIYLGRPSQLTTAAFEYFHAVQELLNYETSNIEQQEGRLTKFISGEAQIRDPTDAEMTALIHLYNQAWFSRLWTVAEFFLAHQTLLQFGSDTCTFRVVLYTIEVLNFLFLRDQDDKQRALHDTLFVITLQLRNHVLVRRLRDNTPGDFRTSLHRGLVGSLAFWTLHLSTFRATDGRDYVYALKALMESAAAVTGEDNHDEDKLTVTYSVSAARVWQRACVWCMAFGEGVAVMLALAATRNLLEFQQPRGDVEVPSWCLDFSDPPDTDILEHFWTERLGRMLARMPQFAPPGPQETMHSRWHVENIFSDVESQPVASYTGKDQDQQNIAAASTFKSSLPASTSSHQRPAHATKPPRLPSFTFDETTSTLCIPVTVIDELTAILPAYERRTIEDVPGRPRDAYFPHPSLIKTLLPHRSSDDDSATTAGGATPKNNPTTKVLTSFLREYEGSSSLPAEHLGPLPDDKPGEIGRSHRTRRRRSLPAKTEKGDDEEESEPVSTLPIWRQLARTKSGFWGVVQWNARAEDQVCLVQGAEYPFVIRPVGSDSGPGLRAENRCYELVCEAYVPALMETPQSTEMEVITLC